MTNPLVSIIVPVYNVEQHITKCIESLLSQDYFNYEVILINDGSTDSSGEICNAYQAKSDKIRVFHLNNSGVSNARNYGIEQSKGDFIQFVDSDDYVDKTYISSMINITKDNKVDLVISGIQQMKLAGNEITLLKQMKCNKNGLYMKPELKHIMSDLIDTSYINYCYAKLISKSVLYENNIRFDKNISLGEDTLFVLNVLKHSNCTYILSEAKYFYLIHSNNTLTYKFRNDKFDILNNLSKKLKDFCIQEGFYTNAVRDTLDRRYVELIRFCIDENFIPRDDSNLFNRLINMSKVLKNKEVSSFMAKDKSIFRNYPKTIIRAIRSRNTLQYCISYYFLMVSSKLRRYV